MKKIDLHIHTVKSHLDAGFTFSIDKLKEYIKSAELDCIAITNHNLFDLKQFSEIVEAVDIPVFPGIEVNLEGAQILVISDGADLDDFGSKCATIKTACEKDNWINIELFEAIFGDLSRYILIPHYEKKPAIKEETLARLGEHVTAGEVSSAKKFMYCWKDDARLAPVYFSDCRISEDLENMPVRQTYINCDEISFSVVKNCLRDRTKLALSRSDGNKLFQALQNGQQISTGLNVIIGERSSGKSHTLTQINDSFSRIKYIRQFDLVARDAKEDQKRFNEILAKRHSLFSRDYLSELQAVVNDVLDIDLEQDARDAESYIESLLKYASETEKHDAFSKAVLFREDTFSAVEPKGLKELIASTKNLMRNEEYRNVIEKHVSVSTLEKLYSNLLAVFVEKETERRKKVWVNELVKSVKSQLQVRSAAPSVEDFDPYRLAMNQRKVQKFDDMVKRARQPREVLRTSKGAFQIVAEVGSFKGAIELKNLSRRVVAFSDAFAHYDQPYAFLRELKKLDTEIPHEEFYRYFVRIDYNILNKDGIKASGGERSEFFLLQELEESTSFDMLLIDEPESSFDNLFLRKQVNEMIKDIAKNMPVVLVTHNSTVGASIQPDYLICTTKEIQGGEVKWNLFSGFPTNKELESIDGNSISTYDVMMAYFEAGHEAYQERRLGYEDLKN